MGISCKPMGKMKKIFKALDNELAKENASKKKKVAPKKPDKEA